MKNTIFTGVGTALVTPFNQHGEIAWEELEKLVEMQIAGGTDAIIACGTTGEAATMSSRRLYCGKSQGPYPGDCWHWQQ